MRAMIFAAALFGANAAQAETYTLDPAHTQVAFRVDRFGYNHVLGRFDRVTGEVALDQAHPELSSVNASIDIASISTGDDTRNTHLRGAHWLNGEQFATMSFRSTSVAVTDASHAVVMGELTLMGQTHPLSLDVTLNRMGANPATRQQSAGFSATGALSRAQWGLATAPNLIGDQVEITIEALAVAGTAPAH